MASAHHRSIMIFLLILNVLLISAGIALSGREIPDANAKNLDKKQPESFIGHDGSVLIPGFGRYLFPKPGSHFDPITYNPITGTSGGNGLTVPGVEVPVGGSIPAPASP